MCSVEQRGRVYVLTLTGSGEHRINPALCDSIHAALARVLSEPSSRRGRALVLAAEGKYFSNGLDLAWSRQSLSDRTPLLSSALQGLLAAFASLPMPTVAAITGHASAGGFILALAFDYRVMRRDRGFLYMSELDVGVQIPQGVMQLVRSKVACARAAARVLLRAEKIPAEAALEMGIVDSTSSGPGEAVDAAVAMAEELAKRDWNGEMYAAMRAAVFPELISGLERARSRI